ncbi:MAG: presenilin family intramembrane aspartyl protease [Patescibacteria group bacterium]
MIGQFPKHPLRLHLFAHTALLFFAAQFTALVVTDQLKALVFPSITTVSDQQSLVYFLIVFFSVTLFLLILFQFYKGRFLYRLMFASIAFIGLLKVFELVFPFSLSILVAVTFLLGLFLVPNVWAHDLIVIIASAGIGPIFGLQFSVSAALILLVILSIYDFVAVFVTKHMVGLAHAMIANQASFALLIPEHYADFRAKLTDVRPGSGFLIFGGGDVILPMFLNASLYIMYKPLAYWSIGGALFGMFLNHLWLMETRRPLPALPFITLGSILAIAVGFFVSYPV